MDLLWLAAWFPMVIAHFAAKHLAKSAGTEDQSFYGEAMAILIILQYAYFFIGAARPFKG